MKACYFKDEINDALFLNKIFGLSTDESHYKSNVSMDNSGSFYPFYPTYNIPMYVAGMGPRGDYNEVSYYNNNSYNQQYNYYYGNGNQFVENNKKVPISKKSGGGGHHLNMKYE